MQARKTPTIVVAAATIALFRSQRANGCCVITEVKFAIEIVVGHGTSVRSRSRTVGFAGRSTNIRLCCPENAMVRTQRIG